MIKCLHYMAPISLIGLMATAAPAGAAVRSDGGTRDPAAASAKSTDAPIMLAQRGGGRGGGGGRRRRWRRGRRRWLCRRSARWRRVTDRAAVWPEAGTIAVLPPGAATGPAFPQATAERQRRQRQPHQRQHRQYQPQCQRFRRRLLRWRRLLWRQAGVVSPPASRRVPLSALPRPRRYAVLLPGSSGPLLPVPRLSELRALLTNSGAMALLVCRGHRFNDGRCSELTAHFFGQCLYEMPAAPPGSELAAGSFPVGRSGEQRFILFVRF